MVSFDLCGVTGLLFGVDMPDDVVWKSDNLITSSFSHFRKAFSFGLIFERIRWKVDTCSHKLISKSS